MDSKALIILSLTSYKLISLIAGSVVVYLGYRLFAKGIWGNAGNLEAEFGDNKLLLKKAAPGTFFALFGTVIISITLYKGLEFKDFERNGLTGSSSSTNTHGLAAASDEGTNPTLNYSFPGAIAAPIPNTSIFVGTGKEAPPSFNIKELDIPALQDKFAKKYKDVPRNKIAQ